MEQGAVIQCGNDRVEVRGQAMKHNFQVVSTPPHFAINCYKCGRACDTERETVWADLNGPAFQAYYCDDCKRTAEREARTL